MHLTAHPETFFSPTLNLFEKKKKKGCTWITSSLFLRADLHLQVVVSPYSALHHGKQWNLAEICAVWLCLDSSLRDGRETLQVIWAAGESQVGVMS